MSLESIIIHYINGNLKDAKKQAKRYSYQAIANYCYNEYYFYNKNESNNIAGYLKGIIEYQDHCDYMEDQNHCDYMADQNVNELA